MVRVSSLLAGPAVAVLLAASACAQPTEGDDGSENAVAAYSQDGGAADAAPNRPSPEEVCAFGDPNDPAIHPADQALAQEVSAKLAATRGANLGSAQSPRFELSTRMVGNVYANKTIEFRLDSFTKLLSVQTGGALTLNKAADGTVWMKYQTFDGPRGELTSCFPLDADFYAFKESIGYGGGLSIRPDTTRWIDVETTLTKAR